MEFLNIKYYHLYELVFPICFFIVAAWKVFFGVRGWVKKRPEVFSARVSFVLSVIFWFPFLLLSMNMVFFGPRGRGPDLNELGLIGIPLLLLWSWRKSSGYTIVGAKREALQGAFSNTAKSLGFSYQDTDTKASADDGISFSLWGKPWLWFGVVGLSHGKDSRALKAIGQDLADQFSGSGAGEVAPTAFLMQIFLGFVLTVAGLCIHFLA